MCGVMINGIAHGPKAATTTCQLHMRTFKDGDTIAVEPWRAKAFPLLQGPDREPLSAFDRIIQSGGYISVTTGGASEANDIPSPSRKPTWPWTRRRASAAERVSLHARTLPPCSSRLPKCHISTCLPQGQTERYDRAVLMVDAMDAEGFGGCTNIGECSAVCPKEIGLDFIAQLNREYLARQAERRGYAQRVGGNRTRMARIWRSPGSKHG